MSDNSYMIYLLHSLKCLVCCITKSTRKFGSITTCIRSTIAHIQTNLLLPKLVKAQ